VPALAGQRLADEAGLAHGERAHWYDSTPAHEAAEWAAEQGQAEPFRRAVFEAYFVHGRNIADPAVLAELATGLPGLNPEELRTALAEGRYRERVQAQYAEARALGVTSVPTFVAGGYGLIGAQPYPMFQRLMQLAGAC
jgi:predicted DsbA family dithiol-disulfide isomerase